MSQALALGASNVFLLALPSGGILAIKSALQQQQQLKGLIISSMVWSVPGFNSYAEKRFLTISRIAGLGFGRPAASIRTDQ